MIEKVNLSEKFALINEHWRPKVVGELNGQEVKLVKFQGEFPWHHHETEDEMFMALKGNFRIEFRDKTVEINRKANSSLCRAASSIVRLPNGKSKFCYLNRKM